MAAVIFAGSAIVSSASALYYWYSTPIPSSIIEGEKLTSIEDSNYKKVHLELLQEIKKGKELKKVDKNREKYTDELSSLVISLKEKMHIRRQKIEDENKR